MSRMTLRRAVLAGSRAAFFCLALGWGMSGALEVDSGQLEKAAVARYGAKGLKQVQDWLQLLRDDTSMTELQKLASVNAFWDQRLRQVDDVPLWGHDDYWATPMESLGVGAGDCEDFVIGKYFSLIKLGVPTSKLRLVYVRARIGGPQSTEQIAHMVLGYYPTPDAVPLVLDSLISDILPATQRRDLTPVFSFNADGIYVAGKHAAPVDRIGRWRNLLQRIQREGVRP